MYFHSVYTGYSCLHIQVKGQGGECKKVLSVIWKRSKYSFFAFIPKVLS